MKATFFLLLFSASVLSAASAFAQDETAVDPAGAACGPHETKFKINVDGAAPPTVQATDSKALVYVVEDQKFHYVNDVTMRVGLDGAWVGANRGDSYIVFVVDPGEHHLCTDSQPGLGGGLVSLAQLKAEAGKVYYFRARISGARDERPSLDLDRVNVDEGRFLVLHSAFSNSTPAKK